MTQNFSQTFWTWEVIIHLSVCRLFMKKWPVVINPDYYCLRMFSQPLNPSGPPTTTRLVLIDINNALFWTFKRMPFYIVLWGMKNIQRVSWTSFFSWNKPRNPQGSLKRWRGRCSFDVRKLSDRIFFKQNLPYILSTDSVGTKIAHTCFTVAARRLHATEELKYPRETSILFTYFYVTGDVDNKLVSPPHLKPPDPLHVLAQFSHWIIPCKAIPISILLWVLKA